VLANDEASGHLDGASAVVLPVLAWLTFICTCAVDYVLTMVIPGNGILLIRSFAEHRARPGVLERTAIVEGSWVLGPLSCSTTCTPCTTKSGHALV